MRQSLLFLSLFFLVIFFLQGCAKLNPWTYLTVETRLSGIESEGFVPEIIQTKDYLNNYKKINKVAFRAPDYCNRSTASENTGHISKGRELLSSNCGFIMSELEKTLVKGGYEVYSWQTVNGLVRNALNAHTYVSAAKELGAEILFEVNSLEEILISSGSEFNRKYIQSTSRGERIGSIELSKSEKAQINRLINPVEVDGLDWLKLKGAMINLNAVDVSNSKKIWFYQWTQPAESSSHYLFHHLAGKNGRWKLWTPPNLEGQDLTVEQVSSESTENKEYFRLIRKVVKGFSDAFSSGLE